MSSTESSTTTSGRSSTFEASTTRRGRRRRRAAARPRRGSACEERRDRSRDRRTLSACRILAQAAKELLGLAHGGRVVACEPTREGGHRRFELVVFGKAAEEAGGE